MSRPTRAQIIAAAKAEHDKVCSCDPRYLMSCGRMAELILAQGRRASLPYDRAVLVEVLVYHYRKDMAGCGCGWAELGRSWPEHVATVYEESVTARGGS